MKKRIRSNHVSIKNKEERRKRGAYKKHSSD